jgi:glutamine amidotransferase
MYLVHSFYAPNCPETIATTNYVEYASALKKNNFTELNFTLRKESGDVGEQILAIF